MNFVVAVAALLVGVCGPASVAHGQGLQLDPTISTYAGNGALTNNLNANFVSGALATNSILNNPEGIAYDSHGNTYIADYSNNAIRVVDSTGHITTLAGTGTQCPNPTAAETSNPCGDNGPASSATFYFPNAMQIDASGNLYVADLGSNRVRKITAVNGVLSGSSIITTIAGTGTAGNTGAGGLATAAELYNPHGIRLDPTGDLWIANQGSGTSCTVGYVPSSNQTRTIGGAATSLTAGHYYVVAGVAGTCGYNGEGNGTASELNAPTNIILDTSGNLYIGDYSNKRVRFLNMATGVISTVAGNGTVCGGGNGYTAPTQGVAPAATPACGDGGAATSANLTGPTGVYIDGSGNLIIGDAFGARVREVSASNQFISTISGTSQQCTDISQTNTFSDGAGNTLNFPNCGDGGPATKALVSFPILISVNPEGNILYVDQYDNKIRQISEHIIFPATNVGSSSPSQNLNVQTIGAGSTTITSITSNNTQFVPGTPTGCTLNTATPTNTVCTIPITFSPAYPGAQSAVITIVTSANTYTYGVTGVGVAPQAVLSPGVLSTVAGTGTAGPANTTAIQATAATLNGPRQVTFDAAGNYYISDLSNNVIRKVTTAGAITTVAGGGTTNYVSTPGGAATSAALSTPTQVALDSAGNLYIADFGDHVVAKVNAVTQGISVFAGNGTAGATGDGGAATAAELSGPTALAVDPNTGNVYIADAGEATVREVNASTGAITTIVGTAGTVCANATSTPACGDGGPGSAALLNQPNGLALDSSGNLYISDSADHRIRELSLSTGVITTVAGNGSAAFGGDGGAATSASLHTPFQVSVDAAGDLWIADSGNNVIRYVSGATGIISTVAGTTTACTTVPSPACGDGGLANVSAFSVPTGIALNNQGDLFVVESGSNRVREVTTNPTTLQFTPAPPAPGVQGIALGSTASLSEGLFNIGNATLTYTTPTSPNSNALVTTNGPQTPTAATSHAFSQTNSTTCGPIYSTTTTNNTLNSGSSCVYALSFAPDTNVGNYTGTLVETDNSLYSGVTGNTIYPTALTQTVNLLGTATQATATVVLALTSGNNPSILGQPLTFKATVSGSGVSPTGTVTFSYTPPGGTSTQIGLPVALSTTGGVTTATTPAFSGLPLGSDSVVATYNGDTNYVNPTASSPLSQQVNQVSGATDKVTAATPSITYGTADQLTFYIAAVSGAAVPAGTVTFTGGPTNNPTALGSATFGPTPTTVACPASSGLTGTCYVLTDSSAPTNIPVGSPTTVTAQFVATSASGYGSFSPTTAVTVAQAPLSNDSVTLSPTPSVTSGTQVTATFFIPVPTGDAAPTGTVTFSSPGATFSTPTPLTATTLNGVPGYASTATTTSLPVAAAPGDVVTGTLTNTDPNYAGGSLTANEVVTQVSGANDKVTPATASITYGTADQLTFYIPAVSGAAVPAGTVTFTGGPTNSPTALGSASWVTPTAVACPAASGITGNCYVLTDSSAPTNIPVGSPTTVTAQFVATSASGYGSFSPTTAVTVAQAPLSNDSVTLSPTPSVTSGTQVTATFFIPVPTGDAAPTGTVTFSSPGATFSTPTPLTATTLNGVSGYASTATTTSLPVAAAPGDVVTGTLTNTDPNYAGGSLTANEVVTQVSGANDKVTPATASITYGTADQLTFYIPAVSGAAVPAGTVTFTGGPTNNPTALGSASWVTPTAVACPAASGITGNCYVLTDSSAPTNIPVGSPTTVTAQFVATSASGYGSFNPTTAVTVGLAPLSNDSLTANPTTAVNGTAVTATFFIPVANGDVVPTGNVTFSSPGATFSTPSAFTAATVNGQPGYEVTATSSNLPPSGTGQDTITAVYAGDTNYQGGTLTTPVTINQVSGVNDVVTAIPASITYGAVDTLTFEIPVVAGASVPDGTVLFTTQIGGVTTTLGTAGVRMGTTPVTINGAQYFTATTTTTALPVSASGGATTVTGQFTAAQDSGYASATKTAPVTVTQAPLSSDSLTASPNPQSTGSTVTATFFIPASATGGALAPTGTVTFTSPNATFTAGTALTAATVNGVAGYESTATTTNLPVGTDTVTGTYTGDTNYAGGPLTTSEQIIPISGTDAVTATPSPTTVGSTVTLQFLIPAVSGTSAPSGTVTFSTTGLPSLGGSPVTIGATPVTVGGQQYYVAATTTTALPIGTETVTGTFTAATGSGYSSATASAPVTITTIPGSGDTLSANPNPSVFGQNVTFTEAIPTVNGITPTGTVTFLYNGAQIGSGPVTNGVVTASTATLPVGSDPVTAQYTGDANYAPVTNGVTQVVSTATAQATLAAGPNPAIFGTLVTLTETLVPINGVCPPGPVTFFSNGVQVGQPATVNASCVATVTSTTLPVGSDAITATAPASGSFAAVTSGPVALVVNQANGADTLTSNPNPSIFGNTVTITDTIPTVGGVVATGTVKFYDYTTLIGTGTVNAQGVATLTTTALPVGTDSLTGVYLGDTNYAQVTTAPVNQVVNAVPTMPTLTVGPNPTTFGSTVTVQETIPTVNGTVATGTVTFLQNGNMIGQGTLNAQGVASITTTTLPVGTDPITATYPGDANYTAVNSGPVNEVVNLANGPDSLSVNPDPAVFGSTVTITDTVPTVGGVAPTGTVTFFDNGTQIGTGTVTNGVATLTSTTLPVGTDPITATYGGDSNYAPITTGPVNETITVGNTAPVLGANPNPTTFGTPVTLTEAIPGINGITPTGTVKFFDNGTQIGTGTLNNGVATLITGTLPIGTDPITAQYSGDTNYSAATSGPLNVVVNKATPTDTVTAAPSPTTFGTSVTLTFTVPLVNGVVPTGVVSFYNGTTLLGTGNVSATGVATLATSVLPVGTDTITAKYPGDTTYAAASPTTSDVVGLATGAGDTLTTNPNPSVSGQTVTLTETLPTVGGVAPTGSVTFFNGTTSLGTGTVTGGVATTTTSTLPVGTDPITAVYTGDGNYATVTSGPVNQVVNAANGSATLTAAPNPAAFGTPVTLTETIAPINGACPAGPTTFLDNGASVGTGAVSLTGGSCVATLTSSTLPVGPNSITATVPASGNFQPITSGPVALAISKAPGTGDTLTANPNPSVFGQPVTLTESLPTVGGVAPTGSVTFFNGTTSLGTGTVTGGVATTTTSTLPVGTDPVTAVYTGDGNYATVTSGPVNEVVNSASTNSTLAAGPNPATFGTPVTVTQTINPVNGACPAGPTTFLNNGTSIGTGAINLTGGSCVATLTTSTLPVGSDSLTATVPASGSFQPITSGPVALVVNTANGPDALAASPNPAVFGTTVTVTDTIPTVGGVAPTGTVNFYDFGTLIGTGTVTNGVATLATATLPVGTDSLTATYLGDSNYAQVTAGPVNEVITAVSTTATLAAGPNPTTFGTPVTVTETIPLVNGTAPTGTVTFLDNGNVLGTGKLNAQGVASITSSTLPVGSDSLTATYPGDTNYKAVSSGPVVETVNQASGPDTLAVTPSLSTFGNAVSITDTIPTVGGVAPTGTVTFYDNGTAIGTGTVTNGVATLTTSSLPVGSDPITAVYGGDTNYASISSGPVNAVVAVGNTTPALSATPNPTTFGTTVTLTEAIPGINGIAPTGTVSFYDNGTLISTAPVKNGVATVTTNNLPIGTDAVTATYAGDSNYAATNSGPLNVVVNKTAPTDTLTATPNPSTFGSPVNLTFTVPPVNGVVPTGVVSFYNGTTLVGTGTINAQGVATLTTGALPLGATTITAKYPGDNTYAPESPTTTVTVSAAAPVTTITTVPPLGSTTPSCGSSVTLVDTITQINGAAVSGTVQFYDNGVAIGSPVAVSAGGVASLSTTTLACGANSITAVFTPSAGSPYSPVTAGPTSVPVSTPDFTIAATPATQTVNPGDTVTYTVSLAGLGVPFNSPVALTATGLPPGATLSFGSGTLVPGAGPTTTTMTIVTSPTQAMMRPAHGGNEIYYGLLLLPLLGLGRVRRKLKALPKGIVYSLAGLILLGGLGAVTGCGGGYFGPQPQTFTVTVTGTSGTLVHSTTVSLTVR